MNNCREREAHVSPRLRRVGDPSKLRAGVSYRNAGELACFNAFELIDFFHPIDPCRRDQLLFLAQLPPAQKQGAGIPPSGAAIKSTAIVVNMYAIVEGRHGRLIPDLSKNDFELTEDGTEQKIEYFSRETNAPLSLGILVDTSPSQERLLATEQAASKSFLGSVLRHDDQAFVMHFDVDVELLQDFTNASGKLGHAIDTAKINQTGRSIVAEDAGASRGGTRLYDAVYLASNELMKARYGRKVLVLVTDGEDQGSKIDLQASVEAAEKANVIVYSIVVSDADLYALFDLKYHGDSSVRKLSRRNRRAHDSRKITSRNWLCF